MLNNYFDNSYTSFYKDYLNDTITNIEINFVKNYLNKDDKILDLCCGYGRHTIKIKESGFNIFGIDSSADAIEYAKNEALKSHIDRDIFKNGDILKDTLCEKYDVIFLFGNTLGLFLDKDIELLKKVKKLLKGNGKFILDLNNRDYIVKNWQTRYWLKNNDDLLLHHNEINLETDVLSMKELRVVNSSRNKYECKTKLYSLHNIIEKIEQSGLSIIEYYGGYDKQRLTINSPDLVLVTESKNKYE